MTDQLAQFVTQLQSNGVTLQTYNGAYNNTTHPAAVDAQTQIVQNCGPHQAKRRRVPMEMQVMTQHQQHQLNNEPYS